ncbi:MAG: hypothetical protein ACLUI0_11890 [Blautia massiliensis (ex Durand et al. 2017)]
MDGISLRLCGKNKYLKSAHNFENDILVASRNIARRYSVAEKTILQEPVT